MQLAVYSIDSIRIVYAHVIGVSCTIYHLCYSISMTDNNSNMLSMVLSRNKQTIMLHVGLMAYTA